MSNNFNDASDTYFNHVMDRVIDISPSRKLFGPMDAEDWPPKKLELESFYLICFNSTPVRGASSAVSPFMTTLVQWIWVIQGTDLTSGIRGRNRGDRGRKFNEMKSELIEGCYPYFTEKKSYTVDDDTGVVTSTPFDPAQSLNWTVPSFGRNKFSPQEVSPSGIVYGYASVYLTDTPVIVTNK